MADSNDKVSYLVIDIETIVDGELVGKVNYPDDNLSAKKALQRFASERLAATGSDFLPLTYHVPVSIVVAKLTRDMRILDVVALDEPECRPHVLARQFWHGWKAYVCPTFVTFNGRGFDLPVMEIAAYRYGVDIKKWLAPGGKLHEQPRYRYNAGGHIDLLEILTNFGAARFHGGLNLAATILGKPGKMDVHGSQVQSLWEAGKIEDINAYCRCDVLDTYFVFLRTRVLTGEIELETERRIVDETRQWLESRAEETPGFRKYLDNWGDWVNPW